MDLKAAISAWPVGAASAGVVTAEGVVAVCEPDRVFPWASVTKLVTALTVLDAWADGTIDLDEPAGPEGSTMRHLLAHASGLPFEGTIPVAAPGTRRVYSNTGYQLLADQLAAAAGGPFVDELRGRVLEPLGMTGTDLVGPPGSGARGPLRDLLALAAELLQPAVLGAEIVDLGRTLAFPGLSGVLPGFGRQAHNDWGLGFELRDHKSPHWTSPDNSPATFGHFGQSGSFLWVDREAGIACTSLCDTPFGPWAAQVWPEFSTAVLHTWRRP